MMDGRVTSSALVTLSQPPGRLDIVEETEHVDVTPEVRIAQALKIAHNHGGTDEPHHKAWALDQMVRALTGCQKVGWAYTDEGLSDEYRGFVAYHNAGQDGPDTYEWDEGVAP